MIRYIEKGVGLHEAIAAAGHRLEQRDGVWVADDELAVQAIIDSYDPLPLARAQKRAAINAERDARMAAGFTWGGIRFDSDPASVVKVNGAVTMALIAQNMGQPFSIQWTAADNTVVTLDGPSMISLGLALGAYIDACHRAAREAKERLEAATTLGEIEAIVPVWPE